ncbi:MAG: type II secretion system F family protein [Acetatifactor sp.]
MLSVHLRKRDACFGKASLKRRDYHSYQWKKGECASAMIVSASVTGILAYFFYRSFWAVLPLSFTGVFFFRRLRSDKGRKEREELTAQFRECILAVTVLIQAGYSVENAFVECYQDMELMYGAESVICKELRLIRRGLHINISLEELLADLGERSNCREIVQFAEVFDIAKRNGGNLPEIISCSAALIGSRIDTGREINVLLGGRKMELAVMKLMPFAIILYLEISSNGYFDSLYHNLKGNLIMTACLVVYLGAFVMGDLVLKKISDNFK